MTAPERYRVGVDVGGTNTDAVLLSLTPIKVVASHKTPTTVDVTNGITTAILAVVSSSKIALRHIECVIIGTTHFVNAVVQRSRQLRKVAVVRLSGAYGLRVPPFVDFPVDLKNLLSTEVHFCQGGFQIDGSEISPIDPVEIEDVGTKLAASGITDVVVAGIYSPINSAQEEQVASLLHKSMSSWFTKQSSGQRDGRRIRITQSHAISSLGFVARENAAILNASLRPIAERTIQGFKQAVDTIFEKSPCALYLTQNDGSVLSAEEAIRLPIRTFNSGPTNSIRGGAYLWRAAAANAAKTNSDSKDAEATRESLIVLDIGGTTSDAGLLLANGLPRMSSISSNVGGVLTNFGMPAVESVGLGGGSLVRQKEDGTVTVGPDSVGFEIQKKARLFGGSTLTATDISISSGISSGSQDFLESHIGDPSLVEDLPSDIVNGAKERIKDIVESLIDGAKIQKDNIDVLIVGGGALVVDPDQQLKGVRLCRTVKGGEVANAVGAAISKVEGTADMVMDLSNMSSREAQEVVKKTAKESALKNGAERLSIEIADVTILPVQYMQGKARIIARAMGELDAVQMKSNLQIDFGEFEHESYQEDPDSDMSARIVEHSIPSEKPLSLEMYKPLVQGREWIISITDLNFITIGCKILGCGGGGDPFVEFLQTRTRLQRSPGSVKVIDPITLKDSDVVGWTGNMGSPEVSAERMEANESYIAQIELMKFMGIEKVDAMIALEIGGANGLVNLSVAADLGVPVVDGDYMGRAYPTYWQTTANVDDTTGSGSNLVPACIASGNGSIIIMSRTQSDKLIDRALRAACVEMGSRAGKAVRPQSGAAVRAQAVTNTISLAWRIGRAVSMEKSIAELADRIIDQAGGPRSAKKVFEGKIIGVDRTLMKGHTYGICEIDGTSCDGVPGICKIPFKNENAYVEAEARAGGREILVSVPDLIAVLDAETGRGLGVQEYRYGLRVNVICIAASPRWTHTARGLELGGPESMGFDDVRYTPVGTYTQPLSVIAEFSADQ